MRYNVNNLRISAFLKGDETKWWIMIENVTDILSIAARFRTDAHVVKAERYGCGHINDTYRITDERGKYYILQKINNNVFRNVEALMRNITGVTGYIARKTVDGRECLEVIPTLEGGNYLKIASGYYRMYNFIYGGVSIETRPSINEMRVSGQGFGRFQQLLDGYPAATLFDTIPDFHNTVSRFARFREAIAADTAGRLRYVKKEVEWYLEREKYCGVVLKGIADGSIPLRVTHNDTKLNNVLIDVRHNEAVAVIDLDTVMKGSILYDFGDGIRSGANTGAEDEKDLGKVNFSRELFDAYAEGFISEAGAKLTETEKKLMAFGAVLMTYECGMRFLTDHLEGDTYFKVHREGHNLDRTRTQMKMVEDMEAQLKDMEATIERYA